MQGLDCSGKDQPFLTLIYPAYNEARRIAATLSSAREYLDTRQLTYEIIVAADGNDGTREIVGKLRDQDPRISVIGAVERLGKGHGIREAVRRAQGQVIGYVDADDKTPIDEFDKFEPLLREGIPVVIGSRAMSQSRIERPQPLYRRVGSRGFAVFMHLLVGLPDIIDSQCGFKFFHASVAKHLFALQVINGYMFDVEILYLAQRHGYRIGQVPVRWRDDGDSRLDLVGGNLRNMSDIIAMRLRRPALGSSRTVFEPDIPRTTNRPDV